MPLVCHLVASTGDATRGGLPEPADRVATHLAVGAPERVLLYTLGRAAPGVDRPILAFDACGKFARLVATCPT